jgi:Transglutaminase-like superfamily
MLGHAKLGYVNGVPYTMRKLQVGSGDGAIRKTVKWMKKVVEGPEGVGSPIVRATALQAVRGSSKGGEIEAVYQWVKQNIEFRGEAEETLQTPQVTIQMGAGDCDDHSALMAALLKSLGYEVQIKTVAVASAEPTEFSHVYVIVQDKQSGQWIPLDTTVKQAYPGWEPADITRNAMYQFKSSPSLGRVRGRHRRLGQDDSSNYTVSVGLSPAQMIYNETLPFAQAGASLLAYGQTTSPQAAAASSASSLSTFALLGFGLVVALMLAFGKH